jgi:myo-inositol-1(or 4)-monophosphatase
LIREAGGFVSDRNGEQGMFDNHSIVAGNDTIHKALLKTLKKPVSAR